MLPVTVFPCDTLVARFNSHPFSLGTLSRPSQSLCHRSIQPCQQGPGYRGSEVIHWSHRTCSTRPRCGAPTTTFHSTLCFQTALEMQACLHVRKCTQKKIQLPSANMHTQWFEVHLLHTAFFASWHSIISSVAIPDLHLVWSDGLIHTPLLFSYSTWVGEGWHTAAPAVQVLYLRTCRRKFLVSARCMKKIVYYFSPWARMRTAPRYWVSMEMEIVSDFYLPHYCSSSAVLNQYRWVYCPPERTSGNWDQLLLLPAHGGKW